MTNNPSPLLEFTSADRNVVGNVVIVLQASFIESIFSDLNYPEKTVIVMVSKMQYKVRGTLEEVKKKWAIAIYAEECEPEGK